ncbi:hypothetical protein ABPG75_004939 [Micractinium tetrahymenae]
MWCLLPSPRAGLALVCKRWCRVFFSQPSLWGKLIVFLRHGREGKELQQQLDHLAQRLQRTGRFVRSLALEGLDILHWQAMIPTVEARLPGLLRLLSPAALRTLSLSGLRMTEAAAAELPRFCLLESHPHRQRQMQPASWHGSSAQAPPPSLAGTVCQQHS